ncbi:hypothetical protein SIN09_06645 [Streptomyces sp. F8]|uniref:hypothetical protein n=1 Tax=Streptomyces sp. F8 TaxID=1436085 RepID=UPI0029CB9130|nr:hypothetical protein [Streptomyces sp. F8]MDX6759126.1 hypothetical protein [Streptomyces sp. F8]
MTEVPAGPPPGPRRHGAPAVLLLAAFAGILDVLIVNVAAPSIQRHLDARCASATLPRQGLAGRRHLDIRGLLLTAAAMTPLIFPLIRGGADGWPVWVWPAFAASALALVALWRVERRRESAGGAPLVPPSLLFQDGLHLSPLASGVGFAGASLAGRRLTARYGSRVLLVGGIVSAPLIGVVLATVRREGAGADRDWY